MKTEYGDLIELAKNGRFDVIIHGCNCHCNMRAGIAKTIKAEFPWAYAADRRTTSGARSKLGSISTATDYLSGRRLTVVNAYTQFDWHGPLPLVDHEALRAAFRKIASDFSNCRIGYPKIGAGLAGGDWDVIRKIIDEELEGLDHTLVIFR